MGNKKLIELVLKAKSGDKDIRNFIIEYFYPKIKAKAKNFRTLQDDVVGAGVLKLNKAIDMFDINKSNGNFLAYAWTYIIRGMYDYMIENDAPMSLPKGIAADILNINNIINSYVGEYGRDPIKNEVLSMTNMTKKKFDWVYNLYGGGFGYSKNIEEVKSKFDIREELNMKIIYENIINASNSLNKVDKLIFDERFLEGKTLGDIAENIGTSGERVRQKLTVIVNKIKRIVG